MGGHSMSQSLFGTGYVVIAEFEVKSSRLGDFLVLANAFSRTCLENEPGCMQFDVVQLDTPPRGVLFYEAYENSAAFDAHCQSTHLARFKLAFPEMIVAEKTLRRGLRGLNSKRHPIGMKEL